MNREKGFMSGVALLTLSAACAKVCGMLFKLPLFSIIGDAGMGYFNSAYVIYTFFFVLSTSGLPVGLSILISQSSDFRSRYGYLKGSFLLFGGLGGLLCLAMIIFPERLASFIGNPEAEASVRAMAPSLLAVCLSGCLRGYFQGSKNMLPTAVSQVVEGVFKTVLGLLLAYFSVKKGKDAPVAAAMALLGVSIGSTLSFFYLVGAYFLSERKKKELRHTRVCAPSFWEMKDYCRTLLAVVLPVSGASVVLSLSSVIDLSVIMKGLLKAGYTAELANRLYGGYSGSVVPLFNLPSVLVAPVASAIIPYLSSNEKREGEQRRLSNTALRLAVTISAPCAVGLAMIARPILTLLFGSDSAASCGHMLTLLSPAVIFVALQTVSGALLQGIGARKLPVISLACGVVLKLAASFFLVPRIGLVGAPLGTVCCYLFASVINTCFCIRNGILSFSALKSFVLPLICSLLCGGTAFVAHSLMPEGGIFTLFSIVCGAAVYLVCLLIFGVLDSDMAELIPIVGKIPFLKRRKNDVCKAARHGVTV